MRVIIILLFCIFYSSFNIASSTEKLILLSTTSLENCGLFDKLLPPFEEKYNCKVKVIAVGSGQALRLSYDGQGDILFTHDKKAEEKFVKEGYGTARLPVMHNYFLVVGPKNDPARISREKVVTSAFKKIHKSRANFVSRGDNSGTHKKELEIWEKINIKPSGHWYLQSGAGMEMTLRIANEKNGYCLVDKATWLVHQSDMDMLKKILEGEDPILYNPYSVIAVSPAKFPWINYKLAQKFVKFVRGKEGQEIIKNFGVVKLGEPLFFPN